MIIFISVLNNLSYKYINGVFLNDRSHSLIKTSCEFNTMKSLIIITVLAALAVCNAASVPDEVHRSKEDFVAYREGTRDLSRQTEIILHERLYYYDAIWGSTVSQEVLYNGNATARITGFRVIRPPDVMDYEFLGTNGLRVKLVSNPGQALISSVIIFGYFL